MSDEAYMKRYREVNRDKLNRQRNARMRAQYSLTKIHEEEFWAEVNTQCTPEMNWRDREPIIRHIRQEFQRRYYIEYLVLLALEQRRLA